MGTTAQKGQRVLQSIEEIQQGINNLGGNITDQTPFKDFRAELDNIYNNLPKTDYSEGSNITLSNTLKGKLDFEDGIVGYGDTSQKSYTGKNKLENDTFVQGSYLDNTSTIRISCRNTKLKANTTYTLSSTLNYSNYNIAVVTSTSQFPLPSGSSTIYDSNWKNSNFSFTTGSSDVYINISIKKLPDGYTITPSDVTGIKFQIEEGSSVTSFEPYVGGQDSPNPSYPQEIEVVRGKNLLDESTWEIGSIDATTGQNAVGPIEFRTSGYIEVSGSVTLSNYNYLNYTYRGIFEYDSNKNYIKRTNDNTVSKTTPFTLNLASNTRYIRIRYIVGTTVISIPTNMQIQLEKGSQATSYLPYNTLEVVERGINYCSNSSEIDGSIVNAGTSVIAHASVKPNTKYTIALIKTRVAGVTIGNAGLWSVANITAYNGNTQLDVVKGHIINGFSSGSVQVIDTYTTPSNCTRITVNPCNDNSDMNYNTKISDIMILEGEYTEQTLPNYEPYQTPQTYQLSLGDKKFYGIENYRDTIRRSKGINLFDKSKVINSYYVNAGTGELSGSTTAYNASDWIEVSPGDYVWGATSTTGYSLVVYDENKQYVRSVGRSIVQQIKVTIAEGEKYVRYTVSTADLNTQQFERGSLATDYEPYGVGVWYKYGEIGEYTFTGEEAITKEPGRERFYINSLVDNLRTQERQPIYSNRFKYASSGEADYGMFTYWNNANTQTFIYDVDCATASDLQNYLANNNTYFIYIRNNPTIDIITGTLAEQLEAWYNAHSNTGTTIIEIDGQLPLIIKTRALKAS